MIEEVNQEETTSNKREFEALSAVIQVLSGLNKDTQTRILSSVQTFLGTVSPAAVNNVAINTRAPSPNDSDDSGISKYSNVPFSADIDVSPKEFMREKQPHTDVERMACLAYYLTHYRDQPFFKTLDLSKLNTDAAQPKFANPSKTAGNALQYRYFAHAPKSGFRQLSAAGEEFVIALPDREAAKAIMARARPKKKSRNAKDSETK